VTEDVAVNAHMAQITVGEERCDVFIRRPVDWNTKVVAILSSEIRHVLFVCEPIVAEPIEVRKLLVGKLVKLTVRARREIKTDKVIEVQTGVCDGRTFTRHPVGQVARLLVTPMRTDQVGVVDVGIIDVFAGLHLRLQLFNNVAFTDQIMRNADASNGFKHWCKNSRFVGVRRDGF